MKVQSAERIAFLERRQRQQDEGRVAMVEYKRQQADAIARIARLRELRLSQAPVESQDIPPPPVKQRAKRRI